MVIISQIFLLGALWRRNDYFKGSCVYVIITTAPHSSPIYSVPHSGILRSDAPRLHWLWYKFRVLTCSNICLKQQWLPQLRCSRRPRAFCAVVKTPLQTVTFSLWLSRNLGIPTSQYTNLLFAEMPEEPVIHHLNAFLPMCMTLFRRIVCDIVCNLCICVCRGVCLFKCVILI